jgi:hypothetical protein
METNEMTEAPLRIFKDASHYAELPLSELKVLDKDTQAALSIKLLAMQAKTSSRILKNVLFFFWLTLISLVVTIIVLVKLST